MASPVKKRCMASNSAVFDITDARRLEIANSLECLCSANPFKNVITLPLKIKNSNAADSKGCPFTKAYCEVTNEETGFLIADVFRRGFDLLLDLIHEKTFPEKKSEHIILKKFLDFLQTDETIPDVQGLTETELGIFLANHLFGKLALTSNYTIDAKCPGGRSNKCPCGKNECILTGRYDDTSVGNTEVWHGNIDLIVNNDLIINTVNEDSGSQCGKSGKVRIQSSSLSKDPQIIAQTIVFSFLQIQNHPEQDHFLTPCISVGYKELFVMLYDAEHDVLLESSKIPLMKTMQPDKFNMAAVILSWLVVNYKFLCTGLTEDMVAYHKADFFQQALPKLDVYKGKLFMGNVESSNRTSGIYPQYSIKYNSYLLQRMKKVKEVIEEVEEKFSHSSIFGQYTEKECIFT